MWFVNKFHKQSCSCRCGFKVPGIRFDNQYPPQIHKPVVPILFPGISNVYPQTFRGHGQVSSLLLKLARECERKASESMQLRSQTFAGMHSRLVNSLLCYAHGAVGLRVCVEVFGVFKLHQFPLDFILKARSILMKLPEICMLAVDGV